MSDGITSVLKVITELGGVAFIVLAGVLIFMFCKKIRWFVTFDLVGVTLINQVIKHKTTIKILNFFITTLQYVSFLKTF